MQIAIGVIPGLVAGAILVFILAALDTGRKTVLKRYRAPENAESVQLVGRIKMSGSHREGLKDDYVFWLVENEETGSRYPVFVNRCIDEFRDAYAEYREGERVAVTGKLAEKTFYSEASRLVIGESDMGSTATLTPSHTKGVVVIAPDRERSFYRRGAFGF